MNELIIKALKEIEQKNFAQAVAFFKQASEAKPKDCAIFWGLMECYLHDDGEVKSDAYVNTYQDCLQCFIDERDGSEFTVKIRALFKILLFLSSKKANSRDDSDKLIENLQWIRALNLDETQPEYRLNIVLNRALMMVFFFADKYEDNIAIFERLLPFKEQLSWKELYVVGDSYMLSYRESGQQNKECFSKALPLFEQGFSQNPSPFSETHYCRQSVAAYLELKEWSKAVDFLLTMASKQIDVEFVKKIFLFMLQDIEARSFLKQHVFPLLKLENDPYLTVFWHWYISNQIYHATVFSEQSELAGDNDLINETHKLIDEVLITNSCLRIYTHKVDLLASDGEKYQQTMDLISQVFAKANNVLEKGGMEARDSACGNENSFSYLCIVYIIKAASKHEVESISKSEAFTVAYARLYLNELPTQEGLKIRDPHGSFATVLTDQSLIAKIAEMGPLAKQVDDLRKARAAAWDEQVTNPVQRIMNFNNTTIKIKKLLREHDLEESGEKLMELPTLSAFAASILAKRIDLENLPFEDVKIRAKNSFFFKPKWEADADTSSVVQPT